MPETQQTTPDAAGVTRTLTGEISSPSTSTPETIVRPPATPTRPEASDAKTAEKSDDKEVPKPPKSIINEEGPKGAPEKYEDFKVAGDFKIAEEVAGEINSTFKEIGLSQADGQKLIDLWAKHTQEAADAPAKYYETKQEEWRNEINSDPEIGGSKWNGTRASIGRLFDSFGDAKLTDGFRFAMDYTGAGNHPDVVRFLARVAQKLTEGGPVRGGGPSSEGMRPPGVGAPSAAQAIYPNLPSISDRR
jgi:hypothetical protein